MREIVRQESPRVGWAAGIMIALLRAYQLTLSPLLGPCCRFQPSCSEFALEALARHGALRGTWLTMHRIGRCHPFGGVGYDPVP